ncbi:hypothetical protein HD554DRAFT_2172437 [Boletus coccyginus]|nr:hypothetical protein HD554DRAFT_2172437 [Boletus coccyginus]
MVRVLFNNVELAKCDNPVLETPQPSARGKGIVDVDSTEIDFVFDPAHYSTASYYSADVGGKSIKDIAWQVLRLDVERAWFLQLPPRYHAEPTAAMGCILEVLLSVYDANWAPIQRARVLVTALGVSWCDGRSGVDADVDQVGREALELLARETSDVDSFASLVFQLKVGAHMWMALHTYRRLPAGAGITRVVAMHVEAAYYVLGGLFPGKPAMEASPKGKLADASSGAKAKKFRSSVDFGTKNAKKEKAAVVLRVTPLTMGEPTCNAAIAKKTATAIDPEPVLGLSQMNVHLLGLLGLIVLKVKLLKILKRVCEHQAPLPAQAYSVICVDLAHDKCASVLKAGDVPDEDNTLGALCSMLQSLQLWNCAVDALSRLAPPTSTAPKLTEESSNPFEVSNDAEPPSTAPARSKPTLTDALSWHLRVDICFARTRVLDLAESTHACLLRGVLALSLQMKERSSPKTYGLRTVWFIVVRVRSRAPIYLSHICKEWNVLDYQN